MVDELKKLKKCYGCGAVLQSEDSDSIGYVPGKKLESEEEVFLCERCFKTHHYGADHLKEPVITHDFFALINSARQKGALIVYVVDVFTFESSFNLDINEALQDLDIILVANKVDLLPRSTNKDKLEAYVVRHARNANLNVESVILTSSTKNYNIDEVVKAISEAKNKNDVYFIGSVSSGKSSLIKTLLRNFKNETSRYITTSIYPNTTMAVQQIPLSEERTIYDTPGLSISNSLLGVAEKEVIKQIVPRTEVKARTYQIFPKQSILIGGLARLDYVEGPFSSFTFYFASTVKIMRTSLARADKTFESIVQGKKTAPISMLVSSLKDLDAYEFNTYEDRKYDVAWNGYGFVSFAGTGKKIRVYAPKGVAISYNESKI